MTKRLRIVLHPLTPTRRIALIDEDSKILASFESVPGTDPRKRVDDARDFANQLGRSAIDQTRKPSHR